MGELDLMTCKVCGSKLIELVTYRNMVCGALSLPAAETLSKDVGIDIPLTQCSGCGLVQIAASPVDYYTKAFRTQFWTSEPWRHKQINDFIIEFNLKGKKINTIMEEPKPSSYDAFLMFNYLEHFPYPKSTLGQIRDNLIDPGMGIIEVPNFDMITRERIFSEIVIDHLFYYTADTLRFTLTASGFDVLRLDEFLDGYILSATVRKRVPLDIKPFIDQENKLRNEIREYIKDFSSIAIWGAGHQSLVLLKDPVLQSKVLYVVDSSSRKQGHYTSLSHIPIVHPDTLKLKPVSALLILVGGFYDSVSTQLNNLNLDYPYSLARIIKTDLEVLRSR